jgi:DNA-binding MarR family transcriptional regulator
MNIENKARALSICMRTIMAETQFNDKKLINIFSAFSPQEFHVMMTVGHMGNCIMSDIAAKLQLSLSSITGIVDKLEAKKIVQRSRSIEDRRIVQVVLTEEGNKVFQAAMEGHLEMVRSHLNALSPQEQDVFVSLFQKIAAAITDKKAKV